MPRRPPLRVEPVGSIAVGPMAAFGATLALARLFATDRNPPVTSIARLEADLTGALALTILRRMTDLAPELARLSPRQRLDLIEFLWESLDDEDVPVTDAQRAELDERIAGFDQGREHSIPWNQLKAELRQRR
jgi:putative addiction module component (TIGR02574 family)